MWSIWCYCWFVLVLCQDLITQAACCSRPLASITSFSATVIDGSVWDLHSSSKQNKVYITHMQQLDDIRFHFLKSKLFSPIFLDHVDEECWWSCPADLCQNKWESDQNVDSVGGHMTWKSLLLIALNWFRSELNLISEKGLIYYQRLSLLHLISLKYSTTPFIHFKQTLIKQWNLSLNHD